MTILSVSEQAPVVVADERHPAYRQNPPLRLGLRKRMQVGTKLVEYIGDAAPTQGEVDAFLVATAPDPRIALDQEERLTAKSDGTILALINQTRAEWAAWAQANLPTLTVAERARFGVLFWLVAVAVRRLMR